MSSLKRDIGATGELATLVQLFERASYRNDYYTTFLHLLDYGIAEFSAGSAHQIPDTYTQAEKDCFPDMLGAAIAYTRQRANLWTGEHLATGWADPFGALFEAIAGEFKKSAQGLFFTPEHLCTMMAQLVIGPGSTPGQTMAEPACGSGRLVLAAAALNPGLYCCANDIDPACTKMTALNMCLNGVVGEVTCMDGLWPYEEKYRFGFQVVPMLWLLEHLPPGMEELFTAVASLASADEYKKTYCLMPLNFNQARMALHPAPATTAIAENSAQVRTSEGVPTFEALFKEVIPQGVQGRLFD